MNLNTKTVHESKTHPGVKFTIRTLNDVQRSRRDISLLDQTERMTDLGRQLNALPPTPKAEEKDATPPPDPHAAERNRIYKAMNVIEGVHFKPAYIRAGLVKIEGLEFDGRTATVESVIEDAPDDLQAEIYRECLLASGLTAEQEGNSQSPTTSAEQEGGGETSSTATSAGT
jgi:hypothetical protein